MVASSRLAVDSSAWISAAVKARRGLREWRCRGRAMCSDVHGLYSSANLGFKMFQIWERVARESKTVRGAAVLFRWMAYASAMDWEMSRAFVMDGYVVCSHVTKEANWERCTASDEGRTDARFADCV